MHESVHSQHRGNLDPEGGPCPRRCGAHRIGPIMCSAARRRRGPLPRGRVPALITRVGVNGTGIEIVAILIDETVDAHANHFGVTRARRNQRYVGG